MALAEFQSSFGDMILGGESGSLEELVIADGISPSGRLAVYRNNTTILLSDALGATFGAVRRLVGDDFFAYCAKGFIRRHPPASPALFEYGKNFPGYLSAMAETAGLPYLGDVARLEWLWNESFHALDEKPMSVEGLGSIDEDVYSRLVLDPHPALRLISSPYPIDLIYGANQTDDASDEDYEINLDNGGVCLALMRPNWDVDFLELDPAGYVFAKELALGTPLSGALEKSQNKTPGFDPTATLTALLAGGAFSGFHITEQ